MSKDKLTTWAIAIIVGVVLGIQILLVKAQLDLSDFFIDLEYSIKQDRLDINRLLRNQDRLFRGLGGEND